MRSRILLASAAALAAAGAFAADPVPPFPGLTRLDLGNEHIVIWYPDAGAKRIESPPAYLKDYEEAGVYASQPLVLELGHGLPALALACDSGPSNDPSCRLLSKFDDPRSAVFEAAGNTFAFLPGGDIYVSGATDYTYDHRRLFRYDGKRFIEVAQPFRYVGIEGRTTAPLVLTSERTADARKGPKPAILTLAAGTSLTVLLNAASGDDENGQNPDYLVRTREGIVGWAHLPTRPDGTTIVEGLRYNGD